MAARALLPMLNNKWLNELHVWLGTDVCAPALARYWQSCRYDGSKDYQEIVGFSHRSDVEEALKKVHNKLQSLAHDKLEAGARVLDIGSGTGIYAKEMAQSFRVTGVDLSEEFAKIASREVPSGTFVVGDFLELEVGRQFALAYSISALQYIPPSRLPHFFERAAAALDTRGLLFLQYPHALSRQDLRFPNLCYVKYSPRTVAGCAERRFRILEHQHSFYERRIVDDYDRSPLLMDSFANGYVLVAEKQ